VRRRNPGNLEALAEGRPARAFLAGAGGTGMRGLARFLLALGWEVWGSDARGEEALDDLAALGLRPLDEGAIPPPAGFAIRSAAVPADAPAFRRAVEEGALALRYCEMLGRISRLRPVLAVAGTHGKTTCTAWIAFGLRRAGVRAGWLVGAEVPQLPASAGWGDPALPLVVESCEYDRSFLQLSPGHAALTNVEAEHPDTYPGGLPEVRAAFREFLARVPAGGTVFAGPEAPDLRAGLKAQWVEIPPLDESVPLGLPGRHNRRNAALVAGVLRSFRLDEAAVRGALREFRGASRRMEDLGEWRGARVVSDYAHHPTEIAATLQAMGEARPGRRIVAVLQPHQAARFRAYRDAFAPALAAAGAVILLPVFRARDPVHLEARVEELVPLLSARRGRRVAVARDEEDAFRLLREAVRPGDLILCLGAGDVHELARRLLAPALSAAAL